MGHAAAYPTYFMHFLSWTPGKHFFSQGIKKFAASKSCLRRTGAEGGIRTPARFYPPTPLAGEPLIATWVLLQVLYHLKPYVPKKVAERVGFEPTALDESPVFKTGSLNHSDISPHLVQSEANKIIPYPSAFVNP